MAYIGWCILSFMVLPILFGGIAGILGKDGFNVAIATVVMLLIGWVLALAIALIAQPDFLTSVRPGHCYQVVQQFNGKNTYNEFLEITCR